MGDGYRVPAPGVVDVPQVRSSEPEPIAMIVDMNAIVRRDCGPVNDWVVRFETAREDRKASLEIKHEDLETAIRQAHEQWEAWQVGVTTRC